MAKKKILVLFIAAALMLTACDSGSSAVFIKRWNTTLERINYEVSIKTDGGAVVATGTAKTEITQITHEGVNLWKYTSEAVYNFTEGNYKDEIESECHFDYNTLVPVYSYRKVTLADRLEDGNTPDERSSKNQSYEIEATYGGGKVTGTATFTNKEAFKYPNDTLIADGEFSYNLPSGKYYDSEQIYVLLRCIDGMNTGFTGNVNVINLLNSIESKSLSNPQFTLSAGANTTVATIPEAVAEYIYLPSTETERECLSASIALSSEQSGPPVSVLLSKDGFNIGGITEADYNRLVPITITTKNSSQYFSGVFYNTTITYSLSDYFYNKV